MKSGPPDPAFPLEPSHPSGWLFALRLATIGLCGMIAYLFTAQLPNYYAYLREDCLGSACEYAAISPPPLDVLQQLRISADQFAAAYTGIAVFFFMVYFSVALLILIRRPREPIALVASVMLLSLPANTFIMKEQLQGWLVDSFNGLSLVSLILFLLLFPGGRAVRPWVLYSSLSLLALRLVSSVFADLPWGVSHWPVAGHLIWLALQYGILLYNQYTRYRYTAGVIEKQQTKWALYGILVAVAGIVTLSVVPALFQPGIYETQDAQWMFILDLGVQLCMLPIPVTLGISILRRKLWDIDPLVRRTFVYFFLSVSIIALYSMTIWYLSLLFQSSGQAVYPVIAAAVVAILFAPIKVKLQQLANRMLYGNRHDPLTALLQLGDRLKASLNPEQSLDIVAHTIKDSLKVPYAGISLDVDGKAVKVAESGPLKDTSVETIELSAGGRIAGWLHLAPRLPGEPFNDADRKLIGALSRHAAIVVHSVQQAVSIRLLLGNLQESREALIFAREEERRAIRRNLHDDIAPRLAAMRLTASVATDWIARDPARATELMAQFKTEIGETVEEIRGIVYNLRPHALDELGLIGAIRQRIEQLRQLSADMEDPRLEIHLDAPDALPILPAAIEVGAYRIATEALVNVVKHAGAGSCTVRLVLERESELIVEVTDDGIGLPAPSPDPGRRSIGLTSLRERAVELGGMCHIEGGPGGSGTRVRAILPVRPQSDPGGRT
ncbi:sensor histidine kinase [Paenibacillus sp. 1P07SE]|uniref:sensor histidine kinase n=1 Tax=Paenibacillus sp. 1P07SE TaxID=3132209 RepID=UPI0039A73552